MHCSSSSWTIDIVIPTAKDFLCTVACFTSCENGGLTTCTLFLDLWRIQLQGAETSVAFFLQFCTFVLLLLLVIGNYKIGVARYSVFHFQSGVSLSCASFHLFIFPLLLWCPSVLHLIPFPRFFFPQFPHLCPSFDFTCLPYTDVSSFHIFIFTMFIRVSPIPATFSFLHFSALTLVSPIPATFSFLHFSTLTLVSPIPATFLLLPSFFRSYSGVSNSCTSLHFSLRLRPGSNFTLQQPDWLLYLFENQSRPTPSPV